MLLQEALRDLVAFVDDPGDFGIDQARASVLCVREYLRDRLEADTTPVLKLNERIYRFAWAPRPAHAKAVFLKYGIDAFDALLVDDRLPEMFRVKRYPQMIENLRLRRARWP